MKKTLSLLSVLLIICVVLCLSGCSKDSVTVTSQLNIESDFSGTRKVSVLFPLDTHIEQLKNRILDSNPLKDSDKSTFEYTGVEENGYRFDMTINFSSKQEYTEQISQIVGREVTVFCEMPDTVLTKGTRFVEDFDAADIISFITRLSENDSDTDSLTYSYNTNAVNIGGKSFSTGSTSDISEREGYQINKIKIDTTNQKDGTYDRTITFSVPNETYDKLTGSIKEFFSSKTAAEASYNDWVSKGESYEYQVIYKGLDIEKLKEYTSMLLGAEDMSIFYGDKNNSSTPLSEGLTYEESFDTFCYIGPNNKAVQLVYTYALPTQTTHGDGALLDSGKWVSTGSWEDGVYSFDTTADCVSIRVPDGIQYSINGINFHLESMGDNSFVRTTDFLYSKTTGYDGMKYAASFFSKKGADVVTDEDDENLICRVTCSGSAGEITDSLVRLFGSGNFMAYDTDSTALSISTKTTMTDYINIGYMLNSSNANRPMTYAVSSSADENITRLSTEKGEPSYNYGSDKTLSVKLENGQATVKYSGNIPNIVNIICYCAVCALMLFATIFIIIIMKKVRKKPESAAADLTQTTTFSIFDLHSVNDVMDMKYREQIDKDIEQKMEADRLENLKKEFRAKELAELERKMYGDKNGNETSQDTEVSDDEDYKANDD